MQSAGRESQDYYYHRAVSVAAVAVVAAATVHSVWSLNNSTGWRMEKETKVSWFLIF
jgi:hypothetical protein